MNVIHFTQRQRTVMFTKLNRCSLLEFLLTPEMMV